MSPDRASQALQSAGTTLLNPNTPQGLALRQAVAQRQGHHPEIIERGLRDSLGNLKSELDALVSTLPTGETINTHAVVLSGNVFTLALRPVALSLLAGVRTRLKPASPGDPFAELLCSTLTQADAEVGGLLDVACFASDDDDALAAFLSDPDVVSVYGARSSIDSVRAQLNENQRLSAHGPGFGAIVLDESELGNLAEPTALVAHDIVAYDQTGCLSPHVVWFVGSKGGALAFSEALNVALEDLAHSVAHKIDEGVAINALRWRAQALSDVLIGDRTHAIWLREGAIFQASPGHRHITVARCTQKEVQAIVNEAGSLLKAIATPTGQLRGLQLDKLAPPRLSSLGKMQEPPLDAWWDGARYGSISFDRSLDRRVMYCAHFMTLAGVVV